VRRARVTPPELGREPAAERRAALERLPERLDERRVRGDDRPVGVPRRGQDREAEARAHLHEGEEREERGGRDEQRGLGRECPAGKPDHASRAAALAATARSTGVPRNAAGTPTVAKPTRTRAISARKATGRPAISRRPPRASSGVAR
jgi:hypothetical protein